MRAPPSRSVVTPDGLVVALRPLDPSAPWIGAWRDLSDRPLVDNLFYHPDFALPAAGAFGRGVQVALVGDRAPEEPGLRLVGAWPMRATRLRWGLPLVLAMGWMHDFGIFGAPLLDAAEPARALEGLFFGLRRLVGPRLMLTHVPVAGPFAEVLSGWLDRNRLRHARFWAHERAFLNLTGRDPAGRAAYLGHLSSRKRRKLRLGWDRLGAEGALTAETIRDPAGLPAAIDDYIALEAAGWKGRRGTAISGDATQAAMMREAIAAFGRRGAVRIDRLRRDGRTLAAIVSFVTRGQLWSLKISYDSAVAKSSPGAMAFHRLTQDILADPTLVTADSCAPPNYVLPESLWTERLALAHILVETEGGDPLFALAARLERTRAAANVRLKGWRDRLRAWRGARSGGHRAADGEAGGEA
ncbi:GNAT family N-acetyltransferase [Methylobacterium sp. J-068]|uniref:GNAT family N-acetyltransferase n=1 Tax=Methylobacterium sp. J-068 TaxID=2836649 RepID=UPI001FB92B64|nr:GNAT family N-acetyltransferase [Methylobacterium sp. J-068]MCJ2033703.1 GNAT family N-acetyltransferase [Methylobacterium sp. J-068]